MTAYNFPNSPNVGDLATAGDIRFRWNGSQWSIYTGAVTNPAITTYNGVMDLSKASYFKWPLTYSGSVLSLTQSFTNVPSGSFRCYVELNQSRGSGHFIGSNASYFSVSPFAFAEGSGSGIYMRPDGKKLFLVGGITDTVYAYPLATAWDISTLYYRGETFSITAQDPSPSDITFKPDGTKMYIIGTTNDKIHSYTLSVPWLITSAVYDNTPSPALTAQDTLPTDMTFKSDGTKVLILGDDFNFIYSYSLSTPWDVSTLTYDNVSFSITTETTLSGGYITDDGKKLYVIGSTSDIIFSYTMSTPWNISTLVWDGAGASFSVTTQDSSPTDVLFNKDGSKAYVLGITTDKVYQYVSPFGNITWDSRIVWNGATAPRLLGSGKQVYEFFSPDGTVIYGRQVFDGTQ